MASTLIFVTAATGNYASYIDWKRHAPAGEEHAAWYYDVDKVGRRQARVARFLPSTAGLGSALPLRPTLMAPLT